MSTMLLLLGVVAGAYLLTHFVVERAQRTFLFVSGIEYLVLGVALGPHVVPEVAPLADLNRLGPVFAFAAGWLGLLYGLELQVIGRPRPTEAGPPLLRVARIGLVDAATSGAALTLAAAGWLSWTGQPASQVWPTAAFLGCAAAAGSGSAVDVLRSRYPELPSQLLPLLGRVGRLGDLLAVVAFGFVFCVFHVGGTRTAEPIGPREWALLTVGMGLVLGALFFSFVGDDQTENNVFLAMVGILLFSSGAAFFLHLPALTVNLVLGAFLAQTRTGPRIRTELVRTAKPASLVLLLFAGSQWRPVPLDQALLAVVGFVGVRALAKTLAAAVSTVGTPFGAGTSRGMLGQGEVTVAMALAFRLVYDGPAVDVAYTAVLGGLIVHDFVGPRLLRALLVDSGEIREELGRVPR
ncbi:MAG: hypothetical protein ABMA64_05375 [Myxococcota bacterium]